MEVPVASCLKRSPPPRLAAELLPLTLLLVASLLVSIWLFPTGPQGWDDYHYVLAAGKWADDHLYIPVDHWGTRLPYVLSLAAGLAAFGWSHAGVIVPQALFFAAALLLTWTLTRRLFGAAEAALAGFALVTTPVFLFASTTANPEIAEAALSIGAVVLGYAALSRPGSAGTPLLLAAGLVSGIDLLIRQTSVAIPAALVLLLAWSCRDRPRVALRSVVLFGVAGAVPILGEMALYLVQTSNPLYRVLVDMRHVLVPSTHLRGGTFHGGSPLFNWTLAALWEVPGKFNVHWTLNPLIGLFTSPNFLFLGWLAATGGVLAWRRGGAERRYAGFVLLALALQYGLNTFVLVISPLARYYASVMILACPLAGLFLARLAPGLRAAALIGLAALAVAAGGLQPHRADMVSLVREKAARAAAPLYVSDALWQLLYLDARADAGLAARLRTERAPVGAVAVFDAGSLDRGDFDRTCPDGLRAWEVLDSRLPDTTAARVLHALPLTRYLPLEPAKALEAERVIVARRHC